MADARLAKYDGVTWTTYKATTNLTGSRNPYTISVSGLTSFSGFTGAEFSNPLPVEMLDFNGKCLNGNALIEWQTATEINNDYFTIQKSADLKTWESVGTIKGSGTISTIQSYQYIDNDYNSEIPYYRLMQTDFDGKTTIFEPMTIFCNTESIRNVSLFPNPASNKINILSNSDKNAFLDIKILNYYGTLVYESNKLQNISNNNTSIDISTLPNGIYFIMITSDKETHTIKFIKE